MGKNNLNWKARFQELVDYKRVYGNCNVPWKYKANAQLGAWVSYQRQNKDTLSEHRRKILNAIGFTWRVREAYIWEVRFQQLVEYKRIHGNCNVPLMYNANQQLGNWVRKQRTKKETMSEERRKKLNSIGFTWKVKTYIIVPREVRFQQLVEYKRVHGNCNVPWMYKENPQLGTWVTHQRSNKETMSTNRRTQLNSIGFVWRLRAGRPKQQPKVRPSTVDDPKKKKNKMAEEAAQEETFFGKQVWDSYFEQLRDFIRTYKHCNVPAQHPELGRWAEEQRQLYEWKQIGKETRSHLTDEREVKLMAVGFVFERTALDDGDETWTTAVSEPSSIPDNIYS